MRIDPTLLAVAALLFFYAIHIAGVRWFGRLQVWMCIILGIALVVLIVPGLFAIDRSYYTPFFTHGLRGFAASLRRFSSPTPDSSRWRRRRGR